MTTENVDIVFSEKGGKVVKRSLDDIAQSAKEVDTQLKGMTKTGLVIGGIIGSALGGLAVSLYKGFTNAAKAIHETSMASKQLGVGVEALSRLEFAARSADLTSADLNSTLQKLQQTQILAAREGSPMSKIFKQLKIDAVDSNGALRESPALLRDIADVFQKMPDGANKSALALKLFGVENQNVIKLLNQGSQGLDEMAAKSDELGYTLSGSVSEGVTGFYDELDDVKLQIEAMYRQALPGLLPLLKDFSGLLNSQEFKDGFNSIIQGAAQAIVWLVKFAGTVANVTKFIGESVAAKVGGIAADDTVRLEDRIGRLKSTIADFKKVDQASVLAKPFLAIKAGYSKDSEANAGDLLRNAPATIKRLNSELAMEQNKLKVAIDMKDDADAIANLAKGAKGALGKALATVDVPAVDWTKLGKDPAGAKGPKKPKGPDPAKELERLQNQLESLLSAINPVVRAQLDLADANTTLGKAVSANLITQEEATGYAREYEKRLNDQLHPFEALTEEIQKQIEVADLLNDERQMAIELAGITERLTRSGITVTDEMTESLKRQLEVLRDKDKLAAAKEGILNNSTGEQSKKDQLNLAAFDQLKEQLSSSDKFNFLNQMLGGSLDETQAAFDAQMEQYKNYYAIIEQFRQQDVANETIAAQAKAAVHKMQVDANLQRTSDALGAAAGLMKSNSKEAFKVGQAAAIGQAIVNTYQGATAAYASAAAIPLVGWILGPLAAAGAIAAGIAQVSAIRAQTMPGFRTGGTYTVGGSGGSDSQAISMRATPGEKISINTPSQANAMERMASMMESNGSQQGRGMGPVNLTIVQQGRPNNDTPTQEARAMRKQLVKMGA